MAREVKGRFIDEFLHDFGLTKDKAKELIQKKLSKGVVFTHDGPIFHADEVFALGLLMLYKEKIQAPDFRVIRTRKNLRAECLCIDVGESFLDHHFSDAIAPVRPNGIRYASAGLLWYILGDEFVDQEFVEEIDKKIFIPIDANDNGQQYAASAYITIIQNMNPGWDEKLDFSEQFTNAISLAAYDILERTFSKCNTKKKAKEMVKNIYEETADKQIVELPFPMEWQEVLCPTDAELVYWENKDRTWSMQCVPKEAGKFNLKTQFPNEWRGQSTSEISKSINANILFVHPHGHYLVAATKNDILKIINHIF